MTGHFYLTGKKLKEYTIPNINGLTKEFLYLTIRQFAGNDCETVGIITEITQDWICFLAEDTPLYDYSLEELVEFIQKIKEK